MSTWLRSTVIAGLLLTGHFASAEPDLRITDLRFEAGTYVAGDVIRNFSITITNVGDQTSGGGTVRVTLSRDGDFEYTETQEVERDDFYLQGIGIPPLVPGESYTFGWNQLVPSNFEGEFFVVARITEGPSSVREIAPIGGSRIAIIPSRSHEVGAVSASPDGRTANGQSTSPSMSVDGNFVAFESTASNLTLTNGADTNGFRDIFVWNRSANTWTCVSRSSAGVEANGHSYKPTITADGNMVVFHSEATNLVAGDTNRFTDVFLHDLRNGQTIRISEPEAEMLALNSGNTQGNGPSFSAHISSSANGTFIVYESDATNLSRRGPSDELLPDTNRATDLYLFDLQTRRTRRFSVSLHTGTIAETAHTNPSSNKASYGAKLSRDGRTLVFRSEATNLVAGDTNLLADVFVLNRTVDGNLPLDRAGNVRITRANVAVNSSTGAQTQAARNPLIPGTFPDRGSSYHPDVSDDGRFVVFSSEASNLGATPGNSEIFFGSSTYSRAIVLAANPLPFDDDPEVESSLTIFATGAEAPIEFRFNGTGGNAGSATETVKLVGIRPTPEETAQALATSINGTELPIEAFATGRTVVLRHTDPFVAVGQSISVELGAGIANEVRTGAEVFFLNDQPVDGDSVTVFSAFGVETFEFDGDASVTVGNVAVTLGLSQFDTAANLATAINAAFAGNVVAENVLGSSRLSIFTAAGAGSVFLSRSTTGSFTLIAEAPLDPTDNLTDGDTLVLSDGTTTFTLEIDGDGVSTPGNIPVVRSNNGTQTRDNIINAINALPSTRKFNATSGIGFNSIVQSFILVSTEPGPLPAGFGLDVDLSVFGPSNVILPNLIFESVTDGSTELTNAAANVFVFDRDFDQNGVFDEVPLAAGGAPGTKIVLVSRSPLGELSSQETSGVRHDSLEPSISSDGRYVVFRTFADNFLPSALTRSDGIVVYQPIENFTDTNGTEDILVLDRDPDEDGVLDNINPAPSRYYNQVVTRVSVSRFSDQTGFLIGSPSIPASRNAAVSPDGRFVVFTSLAENNAGLVFGDTNIKPLDSNGETDIFFYDRRFVVEPPPVSGLPVVAIVSPVVGSTFSGGSSFTMTISATDPSPGGRITSVEYFINGVSQGLSDAAISVPTSGRYSRVLTAPSTAGSYSVYGIVTDNDGNRVQTAILQITVRPLVGLAPVFNPDEVIPSRSPVALGSTITLSATVTDPDGTISNVEFFANGQLLPNGSDTTAPFSINWTPAAVGVYDLRAIATDNSGNSISTSIPKLVTVGLNLPPAVSLTVPGADQFVKIGSTVDLAGTVSDADGTVTSAEFFANGTSIGVVTIVNGAVSLTWTPPAEGTYSLSLVATDDLGAVGTSSEARTVTVTPPVGTPPSIGFTFIPGTATIQSQLYVAVSAFDPDGTVQSVELTGNGRSLGLGTKLRTLSVYHWILSREQVRSLGTGDITFLAIATDSDGNRGEASATVVLTANEFPPPTGIRLSANKSEVYFGDAIGFSSEITQTVLRVDSVTYLTGGAVNPSFPTSPNPSTVAPSYRYEGIFIAGGYFETVAIGADFAGNLVVSNVVTIRAAARNNVLPGLNPFASAEDFIKQAYADLIRRGAGDQEVTRLAGIARVSGFGAALDAMLEMTEFTDAREAAAIAYTVLGRWPSYEKLVEYTLRLRGEVDETDDGSERPGGLPPAPNTDRAIRIISLMQYLIDGPDYVATYGVVPDMTLNAGSQQYNNAKIFADRFYQNLQGRGARFDEVIYALNSVNSTTVELPDLPDDNFQIGLTGIYAYELYTAFGTRLVADSRAAALLASFVRTAPTPAQVASIANLSGAARYDAIKVLPGYINRFTFYSGSTLLPDGWREISWFGRFNTNFARWIYHETLGWLYVPDLSILDDSIFLYDPTQGSWLWTSSTRFPWMYRYSDRTWVFYRVGSTNPRLFFNATTQTWERR